MTFCSVSIRGLKSVNADTEGVLEGLDASPPNGDDVLPGLLGVVNCGPVRRVRDRR